MFLVLLILLPLIYSNTIRHTVFILRLSLIIDYPFLCSPKRLDAMFPSFECSQLFIVPNIALFDVYLDVLQL